MQLQTRQFADNWEKVVFWVTAALFLTVLLAWMGGFGVYRLQPAQSRDMPPGATFLNPDTAFAFTKELPPVALKPESPFNHEVRGRPKPKPPEPPPVQVPPTPPPVAVAKPEADPNKPKTPPKKLIPMRHLEYLGVMTATSGKVLALLRDTDSGSSKFVAEKETLFGFKVKSYTSKAIILQDPGGSDVTIKYGQQREFIVPE